MKAALEKDILTKGYKFIGAIDEAGRGPLAGPVVAVCVIMPIDFDFTDPQLELIKDSKKLTAKRRQELVGVIKSMFADIGIGICDHKTIDRVNILQATFLAMKKAIGALKQKPDFIILDGKFKISNLSLPQQAIVDGDNTVFSIAAASIIAKVTRDKIMQKQHELYPEYGFNRHKGYGTKLHLAQLTRLGPCPIHRQSFQPVRNAARTEQAC